MQAGAPHGAGRNGQPATNCKAAWLTEQGVWVIRAQEIVAFSVLLKNVNFGSSVGCLAIGERAWAEKKFGGEWRAHSVLQLCYPALLKEGAWDTHCPFVNLRAMYLYLPLPKLRLQGKMCLVSPSDFQEAHETWGWSQCPHWPWGHWEQWGLPMHPTDDYAWKVLKTAESNI